MFFSIGHQPNERFPCVTKLGSFWISHDQGWSRYKHHDYDVICKGYVDNDVLHLQLPDIIAQTDPVITGNFCLLIYDPNQHTINIKTDRYRSFPLYYQQGTGVGNFLVLENLAYTDGELTVFKNFDIEYANIEVIGGTDISQTTIDEIHRYLYIKTEKFLACNSLPLKIFLSGGVDTTLLYSYVKALGVDHEVVWCSHIDHDFFYLANHYDLEQHWGYRQIHYWNHDCMLVSGAPGDEFTMRSPAIANLWLMANGSNLLEELAHNPDCLHHTYFNLPKHHHLYKQQRDSWHPPDNLIRYLCNINANDYQHWHLGRTLTWTPFRDLELFKMFLGLPQKQIVGQILSSSVSIELIERNQAGLSRVISNQKNSHNFMSNLRLMVS
jgi:hypothetical protein